MKNQVSVPFSPDLTDCSPKLFIISAPAGAGKTTLVKMLGEEFPYSFEKTVSVTSRAPREGEVEGLDYHFVSDVAFQKGIEECEFLEWVFLFGKYYGTSRSEIDTIWQKGKHCIAVIDVQGAIALKTKLPTVSIFISAPSQQELEKRLNLRGSEADSQKKERLKHSVIEQAAAKQFDYVVVNDKLEVSYQILKSIFIAEEHRNTL